MKDGAVWSKEDQAQTVREGSYTIQGLLCIASTTLTQILYPIPKPPEEKVASCHGCIFVAFDLETISLSTDSDNGQIAYTIGEGKFNRYALPTKLFTSDASAAADLSFSTNQLCLKGICLRQSS